MAGTADRFRYVDLNQDSPVPIRNPSACGGAGASAILMFMPDFPEGFCPI